jgi:hypothetical protein
MAGVSVNTVTADDSDDEVSGICDSLLTPLEGGLSKLSVMKFGKSTQTQGPAAIGTKLNHLKRFNDNDNHGST